jgi:signal peptidase
MIGDIIVIAPCRQRQPVRGLLAGIVVGFLMGMALAVVAPAAVGWRTLSVMSGSMSPAIATGDAVVTRPVRPSSLRAGDVVTFRDPEGTDRLITHRVRWVRSLDKTVEITTKGDANNTGERWQVAVDGRVGRVVARLPRAGFVLAPSASPLGRLALVALPTFLLGALSLVGIWRTKPAEGETVTEPGERVRERPLAPAPPLSAAYREARTPATVAAPRPADRPGVPAQPVSALVLVPMSALPAPPVRLALPAAPARLALATGPAHVAS